MRICHISSAHPAGDTRIARREARSAAQEGHQVSIVAPRRGSTPPPEVDHVRLPEHPVRLVRFTVGTLHAITRARRLCADVYHIHDPELLPWMWLLRINSDARVVYDMHENLPAQIAEKPWIPRMLRPAVASIARGMLRVTTPWTDAIVHATPATVALFPHRRAIVVQNFPPSPLPAAHPKHDRRDPAVLNVIYIGLINEIRGAIQIIDAIGIASESRALRLKLAGRIDPPSLEGALRKHPGWEAVDYHGLLDESEVTSLLSSADIGLVTYLPAPNHVAAYPNKLFEYMSAGVPIIASDFPLWKDILSRTGAGVTVDPTNPRAIASALLDLADDPDARAAMRRRGIDAVRSEYNWEHEYEKLRALYEQLTREA